MADTAREPLMRHGLGGEDQESQDTELNDVSLLFEKNLANPGIFVWLLTFSAGISGLLFGCMLNPWRMQRSTNTKPTQMTLE
jgi:SP family myo-inositol transporter-like MFS transporter 13